jgi:hypothetical protein
MENTKNKVDSSLPTYQKLGSAKHTFRRGDLYSLLQIASLIGISQFGVRRRALKDNWPFATFYSTGSEQRQPRYIDGSFLRDAQIQAKGGKKCR